MPPACTPARITRGRTRIQRLGALDNLRRDREALLLQRVSRGSVRSMVIDPATGEVPWTTLELAGVLCALCPSLQTPGGARDPGRPRRCQERASQCVEIRQGGFDFPLRPDEEVRLVRAMNVLRPYPAPQCPEIHPLLARHLLPGSLLLQGSSTRNGGLLCAHLIRIDVPPKREARLFASACARAFAPV